MTVLASGLFGRSLLRSRSLLVNLVDGGLGFGNELFALGLDVVSKNFSLDLEVSGSLLSVSLDVVNIEALGLGDELFALLGQVSVNAGGLAEGGLREGRGLLLQVRNVDLLEGRGRPLTSSTMDLTWALMVSVIVIFSPYLLH